MQSQHWVKKREGKGAMCFEKRQGCILPEKICWGLVCFNGRGTVVAVVQAMFPSTVMSEVIFSMSCVS